MVDLLDVDHPLPVHIAVLLNAYIRTSSAREAHLLLKVPRECASLQAYCDRLDDLIRAREISAINLSSALAEFYG